MLTLNEHTILTTNEVTNIQATTYARKNIATLFQGGFFVGRSRSTHDFSRLSLYDYASMQWAY